MTVRRRLRRLSAGLVRAYVCACVWITFHSDDADIATALYPNTVEYRGRFREQGTGPQGRRLFFGTLSSG